jgi:hypothetical protein
MFEERESLVGVKGLWRRKDRVDPDPLEALESYSGRRKERRVKGVVRSGVRSEERKEGEQVMRLFEGDSFPVPLGRSADRDRFEA